MRSVPASRIEDAIDAKVALRRWRRSHVRGLVGHAHVERGAVGVGVDSHRADAHLPQRPDDPHGDFTPIGDEDFLKHGSAIVAGRAGI